VRRIKHPTRSGLRVSLPLGGVTLGLVAAALVFSSPASAATSPCSDPDSLTNMPTGPVTVSAASTQQFGRVLVIGSGSYQGCSLYLLTSDEIQAASGASYACSDNPNVKNKPCDSVLWPALLTDGAPIAGPGVNPKLLGTVTRTDLGLSGVSSVQQVTYNGWPLYRFFRDVNPGDTVGADQNDPVSTPQGIWYLINPWGAFPPLVRLNWSWRPLPSAGPGLRRPCWPPEWTPTTRHPRTCHSRSTR